MSVLNTVRNLCESVLIINKGIVLNRVCILGIFCPRQGRDFKPSVAHLYPNTGRVPPPPGLPRRRNVSPAGLRRSAETTRSACRNSLQPDWQMNNASFNRPIIARTHILVHRWGPKTKISD